MAFRVPLFHRSTVVSDEGFRVTLQSRERLRYEEKDLIVYFGAEVGAGTICLEHKSSKIIPETGVFLDPSRMKKIVGNIEDALVWRGWKVRMVP